MAQSSMAEESLEERTVRARMVIRRPFSEVSGNACDSVTSAEQSDAKR